MKKTILTIAASLIVTAVISQNYIIQVKKNADEGWNYMDIEGNFITANTYKKCFPFSKDGYAVVYNDKEKKYQFIDKYGGILNAEIDKFKMKSIFGFGIEGFNDGFIAVSTNKKWGFMDISGKIAAEIKYDKVNSFKEGFATVMYKGKWIIIDKNGNETNPEINNIRELRSFSDGLAPFLTIEKKMGYINNKGEVVINAKFLGLGYFSDGIAWAKTFDKKVGYIDKQGNWMVEPKYIAVKEFDKLSGIARVKIIDKWSYISKTGEDVILNLSEKKYDFSEGLCVGNSGLLYGFFNKNNEWVIAPEYDAVKEFKNGFASVKKGELWGIINKEGKWVAEPGFSAIKDVQFVE